MEKKLSHYPSLFENPDNIFRMTRRNEETGTRRAGEKLDLRISASPCLRVNEIGGFTLIEVLVALAITSIVIAALYSTFFLSRRAVDAVDDSLLRLQESRAVVDAIKREMESALYEKEKSYTAFKLDDRDFYGKQASQLSFTSFIPSLPGLAKISYTVGESDGKLVLKKKVISAYAKSAETKGIELMEDIESFTIEARYTDKWVKTWDSEVSNSIPDEIRVSVKIYLKKEDSPFTISDIANPKYSKTL